MTTSNQTFAEQGVKESIGMGFYAWEDVKGQDLYESIDEWAEEYAENLWENRTELDEERDTEGNVSLEDYKEWAKEKANELNAE